MIEAFLLGTIAASSFTATLFFLKFWKDTRDTFFAAFAAFFMTECVIRIVVLFVVRPNEGNPWVYLLRLVALLLILAAILKKNYGSAR